MIRCDMPPWCPYGKAGSNRRRGRRLRARHRGMPRFFPQDNSYYVCNVTSMDGENKAEGEISPTQKAVSFVCFLVVKVRVGSRSPGAGEAVQNGQDIGLAKVQHPGVYWGMGVQRP